MTVEPTVKQYELEQSNRLPSRLLLAIEEGETLKSIKDKDLYPICLCLFNSEYQERKSAMENVVVPT